MMSTVMNVGQINGVDSEPTKISPRNTAKSPSVNRTGRKNQVEQQSVTWHLFKLGKTKAVSKIAYSEYVLLLNK